MAKHRKPKPREYSIERAEPPKREPREYRIERDDGPGTLRHALRNRAWPESARSAGEINEQTRENTERRERRDEHR
jgi:hypothetical protein